MASLAATNLSNYGRFDRNRINAVEFVPRFSYHCNNNNSAMNCHHQHHHQPHQKYMNCNEKDNTNGSENVVVSQPTHFTPNDHHFPLPRNTIRTTTNRESGLTDSDVIIGGSWICNYQDSLMKYSSVTDNNCRKSSRNAYNGSIQQVNESHVDSRKCEMNGEPSGFASKKLRNLQPRSSVLDLKRNCTTSETNTGNAAVPPSHMIVVSSPESALGTMASISTNNSSAIHTDEEFNSLHSSANMDECNLSNAMYQSDSSKECMGFSEESQQAARNSFYSWQSAQYKNDLKKSEHMATIPETLQERAAMRGLLERLKLSAPLWEGRYNSKLETIVSAFRYPTDDPIWTEDPSNWLDFEQGTYPSSFSLPLVDELKRQLPEKIMELNLRVALFQDLHSYSAALDATQSNGCGGDSEVDFEYLMEKFENEPPPYLVHWGIVSDPYLWDRRKQEKKTEEKNQNELHEAMKKRQRLQSNVPSQCPDTTTVTSAPLSATPTTSTWKHGLLLRPPKNAGSLRPIVKTSHLTAP